MRSVRRSPHRERIFTALTYPLSGAHVPTEIIVDSLALVYTPFRTRITLLKYALLAVQRTGNAALQLCNVGAQLLHIPLPHPKSP